MVLSDLRQDLACGASRLSTATAAVAALPPAPAGVSDGFSRGLSTQ